MKQIIHHAILFAVAAVLATGCTQYRAAGKSAGGSGGATQGSSTAPSGSGTVGSTGGNGTTLPQAAVDQGFSVSSDEPHVVTGSDANGSNVY